MQLPSLDSGPSRGHLSRSGALFVALSAFLIALVFYNLAFFNIINAGKAVEKFGTGHVLKVDAQAENMRARAIQFLKSVNTQLESVLSDRSPTEPKSRVVLMLIDALRFDFIFHRDGPENDHQRYRKSYDVLMPFVNRLFTQKQALPYKLTAKPPTVTLPRLKVISIFETSLIY